MSKAFFDFLKLKPRYFFIFAIFAAILLFASPDFLKQIGVFQFAEDHRKYIGIFFLANVGLNLNTALGWLGVGIKKKIAFSRTKQRINALTEAEKQILRYYIVKKTRTNYLYMYDGIVNGLVAAGIIYPSADMGPPTCFPYNITGEAWNYLKKNSHKLEGSTHFYRNDREVYPADVLRQHTGYDVPRNLR